MRHLDDSLLRRMLDEPLAVDAARRAHLDGCDRCRGRQATLAVAVERAESLLAVAEPELDVSAALRRTRARLGATSARQASPGAWARLQINPLRTLRPLLATGAALALMAGLLVTGAAQQVVDFFAPTHVAPVSINPRDVGSLVKGLPDLSRYGSMTIATRPALSLVSGAAEASSKTGLAFLSPGTLPAEVKGAPRFRLLTEGLGSFTFNLEQARQAAAASGTSLPALPANIDGTVLEVSGGPALVETFGEGASLSQAIDAHANGASPAAGDGGVAAAPAGDLGSLVSGLPNLVIVQMKAPHVSTTGANLKQLEDAILAMPGVTQDMKDAVRAIGDPTSTLPIPVPSGASSHSVSVQGVQGLAIGDSTGIGSVVVWVKGGMVYAVAGTLKETDVLDTAKSLH